MVGGIMSVDIFGKADSYHSLRRTWRRVKLNRKRAVVPHEHSSGSSLDMICGDPVDKPRLERCEHD
jgi:hypothetical protein